MQIALLISGGVDSSVALRLLLDQGHTVTAFYLKIWLEDELSYLGSCPWEEDLSYVQRVCAQTQTPLEIVSLQKEYWEHIVSYTIDEIRRGHTPNPDVLCNSQIKFGFFLDYLIKKGANFDKIATGHYANVMYQDGLYHLMQAPDPIKDQTYFLAYLPQAKLAYCMFPIGHLTKQQVREAAERFDLPNKNRKDSQGICFLGKLSFSDFIKHYLGEQEGDLLEFETHAKLGTHKGFWYYTIGQRQGIGLAGGPWYVVSKDTATNTVYISRAYYSFEKKRDQLKADRCNWITGIAPQAGTTVQVKLRHGPSMHEALVITSHSDQLEIQLSDNDQGIAPGQFVAVYAGQECLGAGIIR